MRSRGGETGGLTLIESLHELEARGYSGQFAAREGGDLQCFSCDHRVAADRAQLDGLRRVEGVSDPADMAAVAALRCPRCGARGTAVLKYGPEASPEEGEALRRIEAARKARWQDGEGDWVAPPTERKFEQTPTPTLDAGPSYRDIHPGMPNGSGGSTR